MGRGLTTRLMQQKISTTIASGTETDIIDLGGNALIGIRVPAGMASTSITLEVDLEDEDDLRPLYFRPGGSGDYVGQYTITISTAAAHIILDPNDTIGFNKVKLVFGASETNKTIELILGPLLYG